MKIRRHTDALFLLDMMMFKPDRCKEVICRLVNERKINPTLVMGCNLVNTLCDDLHAIGLTIRENYIADDKGDVILRIDAVNADVSKVTYVKYHPGVIADRARAGDPYYYKAVEHG